ncbi:MAG: hypothetical protein M3332_15065 [Actinomycetota bacterium]|nr:hypothetical protein [Actinomycetota bacterium]
MEAPDLAELVQRPGPFLTVQLATEASIENAAQRNQQRWQARREELASSEAPEDVLDVVDPLIPDAHLHGETLFVVASGEGLHHASHWPGLPLREFGCWQTLPVLAPLLDLRQSLPPHVLVVADRSGADITAVGTEVSHLSVDGDLEHGRKVHIGGWSHRRYQERAENVWKRNAKDVADAVSRLVLQVDAELVALTGDVRAVQLLQAVLPKEVVALVQVLDGSRSVDGSPGVDSQQLNAALAAVSAHDTTALLDKLAEEQGQDDRGAEGAKDTAAALAMAQVQVLLVHDDPTDSRTAWFGSDPTLVALTADELRDLGVDEPQSGRLIDVFLRSALGTGAGVRIVPEAGRVRENVAAILRWA